MSWTYPRHSYSLVCASDISDPRSDATNPKPCRTIGTAVVEGADRHVLCTVFPEHARLNFSGDYEMYMVFLVLESLPESSDVLYYTDQKVLYGGAQKCGGRYFNKIHQLIQQKKLRVKFVRGRGHLDYYFCDYLCHAYRDEILTTKKHSGKLHELKWEQGKARTGLRRFRNKLQKENR